MNTPAQPAPRQPAPLDPSFGRRGKVTTYVSGPSRAYGLAIQADGKIVAVGTAQGVLHAGNQFGLVRYNMDGSLDASFGESGTITGTFDGPSGAFAVAIQPDGKLVVVGTTGTFYSLDDPGTSFGLARFVADGTLDPSFGSGGTLTTRFGERPAAAYGVAIQDDGKIVVVGSDGRASAIVRYGTDGSLDASFSGDGVVRARFLGRQGGVAVQADGKIVMVGTACDAESCSVVVARYLSDGSLDTSFGGDGKATTPFRGPRSRPAVVIQPDEKIVVAVGRDVLRYSPDGSLDPLLAGDGSVRVPLVVQAIGLQSNGRIVVGGRRYPPFMFEVTRYDSGGSLDPTFGNQGISSTRFRGFNNVPYALVIQPDDKILLAGTTSDTNTDAQFALARFLAS
jgi:uncharacterized delta-60 repeat protein